MSSLVLELQAAAMNPDARVGDILRKALAVATKLKIGEFRGWCERELRGYEKASDVLPYRQLQGEIKAFNPLNGWIPVIFPDPAVTEIVSSRKIFQSIGELEQILSNADDTEGTLQIPFPPQALMA